MPEMDKSNNTENSNEHDWAEGLTLNAVGDFVQIPEHHRRRRELTPAEKEFRANRRILEMQDDGTGRS